MTATTIRPLTVPQCSDKEQITGGEVGDRVKADGSGQRPGN